jgi:TatD DNase family protein
VKLVDTHCHLNFESYKDDLEAVLQRAQRIGVDRVVIPGIDLETCAEVVQLSAKHRGLYAAVGMHPNSTADFHPALIDSLRVYAQAHPIVAIGEIGLDYHWGDSPKTQQFAAFEAQLELASELKLPVIIHNREASEDTMRILENWVQRHPPTRCPGVLHSFSAPPDIAERALAAGFMLGFTGPITYKNADILRQIATVTPLDRIVVETDGPFLTPTPHRGKRNEPAYIPLIAERLAGLKQMTVEEIALQTTANAMRLFNLPDESIRVSQPSD